MSEDHTPSRSPADGSRNLGQAAQNHSKRERRETTLLPPVDVVEDATGITLFADLPGVPKDRLDVHVEADSLSIDGELGLALPPDLSASHAEVQMTRYRRTFTLSKELDASKMDAQYTHGVLRIRIPKAADAQPRRISVQVH